MLENSLSWFGIFLGVSGMLLILILVGSLNENKESLKYDSLLQQRMKELDISSWEVLQKKSGLTSRGWRQLRQGELGKLTVSELSSLAASLNWSSSELIENLGLSSAFKNRQQELLAKNEELRQECGRLRDRLQQQKAEITADFQQSTFQQLQSLLTNYPSIRPMTKAKPNLPAKNLVSLLTPLDNLLDSWDYESIGKAWEKVSFNPQLHQADSEDIVEGEFVYIRFVGYRHKDKILCPAKVSKTLPGGAKR